MANKAIKDIVKYAIGMSNITISHEETIHPELTAQKVEDYVASVTWEEVIF